MHNAFEEYFSFRIHDKDLTIFLSC